MLRWRMLRPLLLCVALFSITITGQSQPVIDKTGRAWVDATIKKLSLEQLVGQMIFAPFSSTYLSSDSDEYEGLVKLVRDTQIGGVIAFGGSEPAPRSEEHTSELQSPC